MYTENRRSEIWYSVVAPSGGTKKNEQEPSKTFVKIARLNSISVSTKDGSAFHFWHYFYELNSFLWHPVTR